MMSTQEARFLTSELPAKSVDRSGHGHWVVDAGWVEIMGKYAKAYASASKKNTGAPSWIRWRKSRTGTGTMPANSYEPGWTRRRAAPEPRWR